MPQADPLIGQTIDEYRIQALLGKGAMGSVYLAQDTNLGRSVAVKMLAPGLVEDEDAVKRFDREARIIADLDHPNIGKIYRIGHNQEQPYYAMEYVDGRSLDQVLKEQKRLGGKRAIDIMIQCCEGLRAAARKDIIHRDIKPANIMLTQDGQVKIVDFGIAKAFLDDTFRTATGLIVGTPRYMSPEQGRGLNVDMRSDIYSLGATFYHCLAGQAPFDAENAISMIQKHMQDPVQEIHRFNPNVPDPLSRVIYGMMEKAPSDRMQTYDAVIAALEKVRNPRAESAPAASAEVASKVAAGLSPWASLSHSQRVLLYIAGGLFLLMLVSWLFQCG